MNPIEAACSQEQFIFCMVDDERIMLEAAGMIDLITFLYPLNYWGNLGGIVDYNRK